MKFRDTANSILDEMRYNEDILKDVRGITKVEDIDNKKTNAALVLYNIINHLWPYENLLEEKDEVEILNDIFDKLKNETDELDNLSSKEEIKDLIEFEDSKYLVIDVINANNIKYLFLINNELDNQDVSIVKIINNNYEIIKEDNEFNNILNHIILDFKEDILKIL